ncbi:hypothetical protein [Wukongibacter baidiensis]
MTTEIYKIHSIKHKLMFVVNDRMNIDSSKNRILFEIALLNSDNHKVKNVEFFMEVIDAKYLCHMISNNLFIVDSPFELVRGKDGKARSFSIIKKIYKQSHYYSIKIDNGSGKAKENGFTNFQNKESGLYYNLSSEQAIKMSLILKDRIFQRELIFLMDSNKGK